MFKFHTAFALHNAALLMIKKNCLSIAQESLNKLLHFLSVIVRDSSEQPNVLCLDNTLAYNQANKKNFKNIGNDIMQNHPNIHSFTEIYQLLSQDIFHYGINEQDPCIIHLDGSRIDDDSYLPVFSGIVLHNYSTVLLLQAQNMTDKNEYSNLLDKSFALSKMSCDLFISELEILEKHSFQYRRILTLCILCCQNIVRVSLSSEKNIGDVEIYSNALKNMTEELKQMENNELKTYFSTKSAPAA